MNAAAGTPVITVRGKTVTATIAANGATTAKQLIDAINRDDLASKSVRGSIVDGNGATNIASTPINYSPLRLLGGDAAIANSNFGTTGNLDIRFTANQTGTGGNGIVLSVTKTDLGAAAMPAISVAGNTIHVVLNTNPGNRTTAQGLVNAINLDAASSVLVRANIRVGDPSTDIASTRIDYSPIILGGGDVIVTPGFVGLGDSVHEVIMRFAETLPDDLYRIEIAGVDDSARNIQAVRDLNGVAFSPRETGTDRDAIEFDLDRGAQVPRPLSRSQ